MSFSSSELLSNHVSLTNNGKWTKEEKLLFNKAIELHETNWRKIAKLIGSRSNTQVKSYTQKLLLSLKKMYKFTSVSSYENFINTSKWESNKIIQEDRLVLLNFEKSMRKLLIKELDDFYYFTFNSDKKIFNNLSISYFDFQISQVNMSNSNILITQRNETFTIESKYITLLSNFEKLSK